jgi:dihydroorotate dehydrogenase electron transfer subunit
MLRRPFSLAGRCHTADGVDLDIIHRVVGVGTDWLSKLAPGDAVYVLGPLGNRFDLPGDDEIALMVGGGVGIPPMIYLAEKIAGRKAVAFAGALTRDLLPLTLADTGPIAPDDAEPRHHVGEFARHGIPSVITTDDGSFGYRGFVTQALEAYLEAHLNGPRPVIYTCGPEPMMKRVADIANRRGLVCQIAVERAMACGMGTCQSCCIRVKKPDPNQPPLVGKDWAYRLACTDGPVFRAADLLW